METACKESTRDDERSGGNQYGLSDRELYVVELIAEGLTDKEIAFRLGLSKYTINLDVRRILQKLDATSRTEVAIKAVKSGLID